MWFGNTGEKSGVQLLFLVEMMIVVVVVADGGDGLLVCFSWFLFLLNLPAPGKGPGRDKENKALLFILRLLE